MSLGTLRRVAAKLDGDEVDSQCDGPEVPAHLDEPPPLQPFDAEYTHCVLFDPERFSTEAERDALLRTVRRKFPEHLKWCLDPASANTLHGRMHIYSTYHAEHFKEFGYVAEIEQPQFNAGRYQKRSIRSERAWHAFLIHAVITDAIIDGCCALPLDRRQSLVFTKPRANAFFPIIGAENAIEEKLPATEVLCYRDRLFLAPRTFDEELTLLPATCVTERTALSDGSEQLSSFYSVPGLAHRRRDTIKHRAVLEIQAWSDQWAERFSADGLILWCTQNLALLRVQATEWAFRESRGYLKSGTKQFAGKSGARASKKEFADEALANLRDGLRQEDQYYTAPKIIRPFISVHDDIRSILAGGIGLEDEAIWRDDDVLRYSYAAQLLEIVAGWVSELRRMRRATLTEPVARLIRELVTGEWDELADLTDHESQAALRLVKRQFPHAVWQALLDAAINAPDHVNAIEVRYRWNDMPTDPIVLERDGDALVIVGPLIDLRAHDHACWTRRAGSLRAQGSLKVERPSRHSVKGQHR